MVWGLISQERVFKVGVPGVVFKPSAPQGEAWSWVPSQCGSWQNCVSTPSTRFNVDFPHLPDMKQSAQLILGFLSEEIVPQVATDSVCLWGGGEFRILLCQHLELEPRIYLDLFLSSVTSNPSAISNSFAINTHVQRFTSFHLCYLHPISSTRNHQDWPFFIHFLERGESRSLSR